MTTYHKQTGWAAVEMVIVLPILLLILVIVLDFGRVMYYSVATTSAARNAAALGAQGASFATDTALLENLAKKDDFIADSDGAITVNSQSLCVCSNPNSDSYDCSQKSSCSTGFEMYVEVTVNRDFYTLLNYPTIPSPISLSDTATFRVE